MQVSELLKASIPSPITSNKDVELVSILEIPRYQEVDIPDFPPPPPTVRRRCDLITTRSCVLLSGTFSLSPAVASSTRLYLTRLLFERLFLPIKPSFVLDRLSIAQDKLFLLSDPENAHASFNNLYNIFNIERNVEYGLALSEPFINVGKSARTYVPRTRKTRYVEDTMAGGQAG